MEISHFVPNSVDYQSVVGAFAGLLLLGLLTGCENQDGSYVDSGAENCTSGSCQNPVGDPEPEPTNLCQNIGSGLVANSESDDAGNHDLIFMDWRNGPVLVSADSKTGQCKELVQLGGGISGAGQVAVNPAGDRIAYVTWENDSWQLKVMLLSDQSIRQLVTLNGGVSTGQPNWRSDGAEIAYVTFNYIVNSWEVKRVDLKGNMKHVSTIDGDVDCAKPDWSPSGDKILFSDYRQLKVNDTRTSETSVLFDPPGYGLVCGASWSHGGFSVMANHWNESLGHWQLVILDSLGVNVETLTPLLGGFGVGQAQWAPDDSKVVFVDYNYDISSAAIYTVDVYNLQKKFLASLSAGISAGHPQWSPDGSTIAYTMFDFGKGARVMTIPSDGGQASSVKLLHTGVSGGHPQWIPYSSDDS